MTSARCCIISSPGKVNLDLRVLHQRSDGFHELRTVFQTVSLADRIEIEYQPARRTDLQVENIEIPNNLVLRAAQSALDAMGASARVRFRLHKRIPMGGGMGGGSSNAAAVLLALPVLAGRVLPMEKLLTIGAGLGSDVPFFLMGGTALAVGRGTELYGLPDIAEEPVMIVSPDLSVSTAAAYQALDRGLTLTHWSSSINNFQAFVRALGEKRSAGPVSALSGNDFEAVVFRQFPQLKTMMGRLRTAGAAGVRMTGSGSAIVAIFRSHTERDCARKRLEGDRVFQGCRMTPARLMNRKSYQRLWRRQLRDHLAPEDASWPPRSRYAR